MKVLSFTLAASVFVISSSANGALLERLGGLAYYDDVANLTWLADVNYAATSGYAAANANGLYLQTGYINANGSMGWQAATDWVAGLTVDGVSGWRLPTAVDAGDDGITYTDINQGVDFGFNVSVHSEMSNMFYNVLGNSAQYDINGVDQGCGVNGSPSCLANTGPFSGFRGTRYLSSTDYMNTTYSAWNFAMLTGMRTIQDKYLDGTAWAVQSGDVSAVPVPAAVWLFGSGLIGLAGLARRKR